MGIGRGEGGIRQPLITTGRLSSRLAAAEKAEIMAALAKVALPTEVPLGAELEVGFGNGEALAVRARAAPQRFFMGSEVYLNGVAQALRAMAGLTNVALTNTDARGLLEELPAGRLGRIVVPHPDPWPKASHHKRRIVQPAFLAACARALAPGGELWVVTDWPDYAFHTLSLLYQNPHFSLLQTGEEAQRCKVKPTDNCQLTTANALGPQWLATPPAWWVPTKYQQKAMALGRAAWFIGAVRK